MPTRRTVLDDQARFAAVTAGEADQRRERDRRLSVTQRLREGVALSQQAMRLLRAAERARGEHG